MSGRTLHWLGLGLVTTAGAGVMALTAMMNSAFAYGDTAAITGDYAGVPVEVMGASGLPNPLTQPGSGSNSRSGQLRSNGSKSVLHAGFRPPPQNRWSQTCAPSSPRNVTRAREIATRMSKPAESVTTAADLLEETASRRGFG